MNINLKYLSTNYLFNTQFSKNKYKNKIISIFTDKHLKDNIYVLNSGLLANSYFRKNQLIPNSFYANMKNVSIVNQYFNNWGLFYLYPIDYNKKQLENQKNNFNTLQKHYLNKKLLIKSISINLSLKKNNKIIDNLVTQKQINKKNISIFSLFELWQKSKQFDPLELLVINKVIKKYRKANYYFDYKGGIFIMRKKFIKKLMSFNLFKKKLKISYKKNIQAAVALNNLLKRIDLHYFLKSKLYLYVNYCLYTSKNVVIISKRMNVKNIYTIFGKKFHQTKPALEFVEIFFKKFRNLYSAKILNDVKTKNYLYIKKTYALLNLYYLYNKINFYVFKIKYLLFFDYLNIILNNYFIKNYYLITERYKGISTQFPSKNFAQKNHKTFYLLWEHRFKYSEEYLKFGKNNKVF